MSLRLMEVILPGASETDTKELFGEREIQGSWRDVREDGRTVFHLLVPVEETEPIMDTLEQRFSGLTGFSVVLLPTEAVLPRPESKPEKGEEKAIEQEPEEKTNRVSREELYANIAEGMEATRTYVVLIVLSSVVAAVGLVRNDLAVIIGAMVIAPMLSPNMALALATTLGDFDLARRALRSAGVGIVLGFAVSVVIGRLYPVDPGIPAIVSRTHAGPSDIMLALAAGSAGTFAYTSGLSGAVIGVMVAVALVPPLVASGMLLGSGNTAAALGALLLTLANMICVNLAGVVTFLAQGVRPRAWWEAERARRATTIATAVWILLLGLLLVILFVLPRARG